MIKTLLPGARRLIAVTTLTDRALPAAQLAAHSRGYCNDVSISDTIEDAIMHSVENIGRDEIICAFGSLYYIGAVRDYFSL
jgi:dihydrofolate synthase/folylpolyglutamate synthase